MKDLYHSLLDHNLAMLRAIAEGWGLALNTNRQAEAAKYLAGEMPHPEKVGGILENLSEKEREALEAVAAAGGRMKAHLFHHYYGHLRPLGPGRLELERPWLSPATPAERLWYLGFIFKSFAEVERYRTEFVYIPTDLLLLLPPVESPTFSVAETHAPESVRQREKGLVWDVFDFLCYLQNEGVRAVRSGLLPRPDIEKLCQLLAEQGEGAAEAENKLAFIFHLCQAMELITVRDGFLKPYPPRAKEWLKERRAKQFFSLAATWREDKTWNELRQVEDLRCEDTGWSNDPLLARRKLLEHLSRCRAGRWLSLDSFIAAVKKFDPDFQRPDGDYASWYIRHASTGEYLMGFERWDEVEGALIKYIIGRPLWWLGEVALGYAADEESFSCFLITSWGEALLKLKEGEEITLPEEGEEPEPLTVETDFTIRVPAGTDLYKRFQLERFAQAESRGEEALYRLTRRSLERARRQGISAQMILNFLRRNAAGKLPSNVERALQRWEGEAEP